MIDCSVNYLLEKIGSFMRTDLPQLNRKFRPRSGIYVLFKKLCPCQMSCVGKCLFFGGVEITNFEDLR